MFPPIGITIFMALALWHFRPSFTIVFWFNIQHMNLEDKICFAFVKVMISIFLTLTSVWKELKWSIIANQDICFSFSNERRAFNFDDFFTNKKICGRCWIDPKYLIELMSSAKRFEKWVRDADKNCLIPQKIQITKI